MRYAQLVVGPAGSGKSTYCSVMKTHAENEGKVIEIVNLDPAAEYFEYEAKIDIRELIQVDDAMEDQDLKFGPNGGLIFCMQYLLENVSWLEEELGDTDDDYIIFDCPGQIELYTHMNVMQQLIEVLQKINFRVCTVFIIDSQFMVDAAKFISGTMTALSVMVNLALPHLNVLSKIDLLSKNSRKHLDKYLDPDSHELLLEIEDNPWNKKYYKLTQAIGKMIEDYSLVKFLPLNISDEESVADIKMAIDNVLQYGEDADVKTKEFDNLEDNDVE